MFVNNNSNSNNTYKKQTIVPFRYATTKLSNHHHTSIYKSGWILESTNLFMVCACACNTHTHTVCTWQHFYGLFYSCIKMRFTFHFRHQIKTKLYTLHTLTDLQQRFFSSKIKFGLCGSFERILKRKKCMHVNVS